MLLSFSLRCEIIQEVLVGCDEMLKHVSVYRLLQRSTIGVWHHLLSVKKIDAFIDLIRL